LKKQKLSGLIGVTVGLLTLANFLQRNNFGDNMHLNSALKRTLLIGGIGLAMVITGLAISARTPASPAPQQPTLAGNPEPVASNP